MAHAIARLQRFAEFGVGQTLRGVDEMVDIPRRLGESRSVDGDQDLPCRVIDPRPSSPWMGVEFPELVARRK
jgi:hypothetical protein